LGANLISGAGQSIKIEEVKPNVGVRGPIFSELVQIIETIPMGDSLSLERASKSNLLDGVVLLGTWARVGRMY
jgi:hypothetical protein